MEIIQETPHKIQLQKTEAKTWYAALAAPKTKPAGKLLRPNVFTGVGPTVASSLPLVCTAAAARMAMSTRITRRLAIVGSQLDGMRIRFTAAPSIYTTLQEACT